MRAQNKNEKHTVAIGLATVCLVLLPAWLPVMAAAGQSANCHAPLPGENAAGGSGSSMTITPGVTHIDADEVTSKDNNEYTFSGSVKLLRDGVSVSSDRIDYIKSQEKVTASGAVTLSRQDAQFTGSRLLYNLQQQTGQLEQVGFLFRERPAYGKADKLEIPGKGVHRLYSSSYTTCAGEDPDWQLNTRMLNLDANTNTGTARHVWLEFMDVPVFYLPYLSFPLSGRKTGLLVPTFGRSSQLGTKITVPYYFNIAPDLDATLTLDNFTRRGQRLSGEMRFLNAHDHGEIIAEYLPDDEVIEDDREYLFINHESNLFDGLSTKLTYRRASDSDYFEDFGDGLDTINITHLESRAEATYRGSGWLLQGRVIEYQTLDETIPALSRPYKVRPSLAFNYSPLRRSLFRPQLRAEAVNFEREGRVSGTRLDLEPSLSLPLEADAGFIRPRISLRHTRYALDAVAPSAEDAPTRSLPVYSIDSGLVFERDLAVDNRPYLQTLEPRLFFLHVPFRDQADLVVDQSGQSRVFDTALANQSFSQLFALNRFSGADRVGDTSQVSLAITTRFVDNQSGAETLSASIGRTRFFRDREVSLPGGQVQTGQFSNIFAELRARPGRHLSVNANVEWDTGIDKGVAGRFRMQYNKPGEKILNLTYLIQRDALGVTSSEQSDISVFWPISHNWNLIARRHYNLLDNRVEELLGGLEYNSCCWAFRIVGRRSVLDVAPLAGPDQVEHDRSILFQLELKGLTAIGKDVKSLLQNTEYGISGY